MTWFLPSLGRATRMKQFIESYVAAEETVDVKVLLASWDPKIEEYNDVPWPSHWEVVRVDEVHCGPTHNAAFARWPNEKCYGLMDDDILIRTPRALTRLEKAAGDYLIAYAEDGFHSDSYTVMPCLGGELVRLCGFVLTPDVMHNGCEGVWNDLGRKFYLLRFQKDILLEHMHPFFKKAEHDSTYEHGEKISRENQGAYDRWVSRDYAKLAERVGEFLKERGHTRESA